MTLRISGPYNGHALPKLYLNALLLFILRLYPYRLLADLWVAVVHAIYIEAIEALEQDGSIHLTHTSASCSPKHTALLHQRLSIFRSHHVNAVIPFRSCLSLCPAFLKKTTGATSPDLSFLKHTCLDCHSRITVTRYMILTLPELLNLLHACRVDNSSTPSTNILLCTLPQL